MLGAMSGVTVKLQGVSLADNFTHSRLSTPLAFSKETRARAPSAAGMYTVACCPGA